jgi:uncharacterized protein (DUF305 family)
MNRNDVLARVIGTVGALVVSVAVASCGGAAAPTAAAPAPAAPAAAEQQFNDADVQFAQSMIPHHQQAVQMAELAADRADNAEVTALAEQIRGAQDPEVATLTGFLRSWNAEVPDAAMTGMEHGAGGMAGMMTPEQLTELSEASGAEFDRMFLEMMIAHHESAVADAQREQGAGLNAAAKALAGQIATVQAEELGRMQELLQNL